MTIAVPAALMSRPRSRCCKERSVVSRALAAFFIFRVPVLVLRRRIVGLLFVLPHGSATDRPQFLAAAGGDQKPPAALAPLPPGAERRRAAHPLAGTSVTQV